MAWVVAWWVWGAVALAGYGDSYVPPAPPPRVVTVYREVPVVTYRPPPSSWTSSASSAPWTGAPASGGAGGPIDPMEADEAACERGAGFACGALGAKLYDRKRYDEARVAYRKACDLGAAWYCINLGAMLLEDLGGSADLIGARRLLDPACQQQRPEACALALSMRLHGVGGRRDDPAAVIPGLKRACEQDRVTFACAELPAALRLAGRDAEAVQADAAVCQQGFHEWIVPSCRQAAAAYDEGVLLQRLPGLARDLYAQACRWDDSRSCVEAARLAVEVGDPRAESAWFMACSKRPSACAEYAEHLRDGTFGEPKPLTAALSFEKACEVGDLDACAEAGRLGAFVVDPPRAPAATALERACRGDQLHACVGLAALKVGGTLVEPDRAGAIALLERTCPAIPSSCALLGWSLSQDRPDDPSALELLDVGCDAGDLWGCARRAELTLGTSASDLAPLERACTSRMAFACELLADHAPDARQRWLAAARACALGAEGGCAAAGSRDGVDRLPVGTMADVGSRLCRVVEAPLAPTGEEGLWSGYLSCLGAAGVYETRWVEDAPVDPRMPPPAGAAVKLTRVDSTRSWVQAGRPAPVVGEACRVLDASESSDGPSGWLWCAAAGPVALSPFRYVVLDEAEGDRAPRVDDQPAIPRKSPVRVILATGPVTLSGAWDTEGPVGGPGLPTRAEQVSLSTNARCTALDELTWRDGWHHGRVRCEVSGWRQRSMARYATFERVLALEVVDE